MWYIVLQISKNVDFVIAGIIIHSKIIKFFRLSMFGSLATVSSNQGVNIVMNLFYGVTINAAMGISHQVAQAVNQFITNFQIAFNPQITKSYASGNFSYLNSLIEHSAKLSFSL